MSTCEISECSICEGQYTVMISLDQILNQCESLTVAQVLQNLHFLTIPELKRLGAVLCFICVAKVQSCFKIKTQCYQIGNELELESAFSGSSKVSPLAPLKYITPNTIHNKISEENSTANENFSKSYTITDVKQERDVTEIENISTNKETVIQTMNATYSCEIKMEKDESFTQIIDFDSNKQKSKGKHRFVCDVCNKNFTTSSSLVKHRRLHAGEKPYACDVCNKKFSCSSSLVRHKRVHTGEKPYACDVCNKKYTDSGSLVKHKRFHTGERPYACDVCNKKYSSSSSLVLHKRIHTGERPYVCDVCNKSFSYPRNLTLHIRIHTDERPYECDVCNKSFIHSNDLVRHKRTHTGEKPYACDVCNKSFSYIMNLTAHKRTHTGEKPYVCNVCNKSFSSQSNLVRHKRSHTVNLSKPPQTPSKPKWKIT